MCFINLSDEQIKQKYDNLIKQGLSEDEAFTEIYSEDCCLDKE